MKTTAEAVKAVIQSQAVDTLLAEDMGTGEKVGHCQGTQAELAAQVDFLEANLLMPYRVKLSKSTADRKRGAKAPEDKPFVFTLLGRSGAMQQPVVNTAQPIAPPAPPSLELVREAATNGVRNEVLANQLKAQAERIAELERQLQEAEGELEDEDQEPVNAAPQSAWNSPEVIKELIGVLRPIGEAAGQWIGGKMKPTNGTKVAAKPEQVANAAEGMTDEERRMLVAMRNWRKAAPEQAEGLLSQLVDNFAAETPENVPSGNGQA